MSNSRGPTDLSENGRTADDTKRKTATNSTGNRPKSTVRAGSYRKIEQGETYVHREHGLVEVAGIWKGTEQLESARYTDEKDTIIVRFTTRNSDERAHELADTFGSFVRSLE